MVLERFIPNIPVPPAMAKIILVITGFIILLLTISAFMVLKVNPLEIFTTRAWIPVVLGLFVVAIWTFIVLKKG